MYDERRLDYVVEAVKYVIDHLGPQDRAVIVAFADRAQAVATVERQEDKSRAKKAIDDIDLLEIGGGTQMALGMEAALAEVERHYAAGRLNRILVLTDGQTYEERRCLEVARQKRERVSFSTLGVGAEFNEKLLMEIAEAGGANYHFIGDPADIPRIFSQELEGLKNVALLGAELEVRLSAGVQMKEAFRASPQIYAFREAALGPERAVAFSLGDSEAGVASSVLLTLILPPRRPGRVRLVQATLRYGTPEAKGQREDAEVVVEYTAERALVGKVNAHVMNLVDQVSIAKLQSQAEAALAAGNVDKATRLLGNAIAGTQRLGHSKATQALTSLREEIHRTQTLAGKAAKTRLLSAQAEVRKTQLLDPEVLLRNAQGN
jgi:Ca-activated chloride channel family protein